MAQPPEEQPAGYWSWSRDPAVGLFAVLPLWLLYEGLRLLLAPDERNGAEALLSEAVRLVGPRGFALMRVVFACLVLACATSILHRRVPWLRVTLVNALEGIVYALILGPLAGALELTSARVLHTGTPLTGVLLRDLVGSLGAGIFEELVFRLMLLSVLALLLMRAAEAFALPRALGVAVALVLSALLFSLFHHIGPGTPPIEQRVFVFRTMAGLVLGLLFVLRGFGVCVYTHALYDAHYYLTTHWTS